MMEKDPQRPMSDVADLSLRENPSGHRSPAVSSWDRRPQARLTG